MSTRSRIQELANNSEIENSRNKSHAKISEFTVLFSRINILFSFKFCIIIVFYSCLNYFEVSETLIIGFVLIFMRLFQIYQTYSIIRIRSYYLA